jgi:hypothetical protein
MVIGFYSRALRHNRNTSALWSAIECRVRRIESQDATHIVAGDARTDAFGTYPIRTSAPIDLPLIGSAPLGFHGKPNRGCSAR